MFFARLDVVDVVKVVFSERKRQVKIIHLIIDLKMHDVVLGFSVKDLLERDPFQIFFRDFFPKLLAQNVVVVWVLWHLLARNNAFEFIRLSELIASRAERKAERLMLVDRRAGFSGTPPCTSSHKLVRGDALL